LAVRKKCEDGSSRSVAYKNFSGKLTNLELAGEGLITQASSHLNRLMKCEDGSSRSVAYKSFSGKLTNSELAGEGLITQASSHLNRTNEV